MDEFRIRVVPRPWNKGKIVGQKAPLKLKEIWAIRPVSSLLPNARIRADGASARTSHGRAQHGPLAGHGRKSVRNHKGDQRGGEVHTGGTVIGLETDGDSIAQAPTHRGRNDLVPPPPRPQFLRWLVFVIGNIHPTHTYADVPGRFVAGEEAQRAFEANVNAYARRLWGIMEAQASAPWFLGAHFTALDLFIAVMTKWRPTRA